VCQKLRVDSQMRMRFNMTSFCVSGYQKRSVIDDLGKTNVDSMHFSSCTYLHLHLLADQVGLISFGFDLYTAPYLLLDCLNTILGGGGPH